MRIINGGACCRIPVDSEGNSEEANRCNPEDSVNLNWACNYKETGAQTSKYIIINNRWVNLVTHVSFKVLDSEGNLKKQILEKKHNRPKPKSTQVDWSLWASFLFVLQLQYPEHLEVFFFFYVINWWFARWPEPWEYLQHSNRNFWNPWIPEHKWTIINLKTGTGSTVKAVKTRNHWVCYVLFKFSCWNCWNSQSFGVP